MPPSYGERISSNQPVRPVIRSRRRSSSPHAPDSQGVPIRGGAPRVRCRSRPRWRRMSRRRLPRRRSPMLGDGEAQSWPPAPDACATVADVERHHAPHPAVHRRRHTFPAVVTAGRYSGRARRLRRLGSNRARIVRSRSTPAFWGGRVCPADLVMRTCGWFSQGRAGRRHHCFPPVVVVAVPAFHSVHERCRP
jgi:hypothetical protein